jgi:peptidoglycan hydrolase-like protein with peptidoglycan-binding domain
MDLQRLLAKAGYNVGEPDGKLGNATRTAVKQAQIKAGLPADSWPTPELVAKLQTGKTSGATR